MSNLLAAITDGLSEGGIDLVGQLTDGLTQQVGNLGSLGDSLSGMMEEPAALTDLVRSLDEGELPVFDIGSALPDALEGLQQALPADTANVLGPLLQGLDQLETTVVGDLANVVTEGMQAALAIYDLTQLRFGAAAAEGPHLPASEPVGGVGGDEGVGGGGGGDAPAEEPPRVSAALDTVDSLLDLFPEEVDVKALVTLLVQIGAKRSQLPFKLPVLDDLGDELQTLMGWEEMDAPAVQAQLGATLGDLAELLRAGPDKAFSVLEQELDPVREGLRIADLQQISSVLRDQLATIAAAVEAGDLSGIGPAMGAIEGACALGETVGVHWTGGVQEQLARWRQRLACLPEDLDVHISQRVGLLRPVGLLDDLGSLFPSSAREQEQRSVAVAEFSAELDRYVAWAWDLVNRIDLQAVEEPLATAAQGARSAVDGLDDTMVQVAMQVQSLFGEAEAIVDQVDMAAIADSAAQAISDFRQEITDRLQELTQPIRDAVEALITSIRGTLDSFDPAVVADACRQVIDALESALGSSELQDAVGRIREAIDTAAARLDELSFAPVTEQVVRGVDEATQALESIDASQLNPVLRTALDAAVGLLPQDISALTDPLIDDLGRLIEEEAPMPQIRGVLDKPQQALGFVRQYEPRTLIGSALSEPFDALHDRLTAFRPSTMVREPLERVIDTLKERLETHANPALLLDPLIPLFDQLMARIDALDPGALVEPLEARIQALIDRLLDALRIDEVLEQVGAVLDRISEVIGAIDHARAILQRLDGFLEGLADPQGQFDAWLGPILDKLELPAASGPLDAFQAELAAAVEGLEADALRNRFGATADAVLAELEGINADQLLVPAIQAYRSISREQLSIVEGFDAEKAALEALLDDCNPMQLEFSGPFQGLADFTASLRQAGEALEGSLAGWDARWHAAGQPLAELRALSVRGDALRTQLSASLQSRMVAPFVSLFGAAAPLRDALSPILDNLERMVTLLQAKLDSALLGPDALGGAYEAMDGLIERLRDIDLGFLRESLGALFANLQGKMHSLSPAALKTALDSEFQRMLEALDLGLLMPEQSPDPLDQTYDDLVEDFAALDPDALLVNDLQATFEEHVVPLLDSFDLTPLVQRILDRLAALDDELKAEMQRVNGSYNGLLQAIP
jgi:hypothetical protein